MRRSVLVLVAVACLAAFGCSYIKSGASPTGPSESDGTTTASTNSITTGQTVSAVDGGAMANITVRVNSGAHATSDGSGRFAIKASGGRQTAVISGPGVIERKTGVKMPGPHLVLSLIPSSFDLTAFNQMVRMSGDLQRWTARPSLVVEKRLLAFTSTWDTDFPAMDEEMSDGEVADLVGDLTEGLKLLGAGHLQFASVTAHSAAPGSRVGVARTNTIFVARYSGLRRSGYVGFGRWATSGDDSVVAGAIFLDRDFDKNVNGGREAVRVHELGHGLGYNHVTARSSVMNPTPRTLPNAFDQQAAAIAFQRQPGNRSPDVDVSGFSANLTAFGSNAITWHAGLR